MAKIKLAPRNLTPLINRNLSNDNVTLFLTPNYSETSFLSSLLPPPPSSIRGLKGWGKGWRRVEEKKNTHRNKDKLQLPECPTRTPQKQLAKGKGS